MSSNQITILVADDMPEVREVLGEMLRRQGYQILYAANGKEAFDQAISYRPDLVLLDVMMPLLDGFEVCRRLRADKRTAEVPILLVTALDDQASRVQGIEAGADDFISKPFNRAELRARIGTIARLNRYRRLHEERAKFERIFALSPDGILVVDASGTIRLANDAMVRLLSTPEGRSASHESFLEMVTPDQREHCRIILEGAAAELVYAERVETVLLRDGASAIPVELQIGPFVWDDQPAAQIMVRNITDRKRAEQQIHALNTDLLRAYDATLEGWVKAVDLRDRETEGHSQRVTTMTIELAQAIGVPHDQLIHIQRGALLHDIGKLGIPDRILLKPGPLTAEEWQVMRMHPVYAYEWLSPIEYLRPALDIPYCHHEKWDGSGYPRGLRGEQIPMAARIFSVADVWDALSHDRPYRPAWPADRVRAEIASCAGTAFDPQVVEVFLCLRERCGT